MCSRTGARERGCSQRDRRRQLRNALGDMPGCGRACFVLIILDKRLAVGQRDYLAGLNTTRHSAIVLLVHNGRFKLRRVHLHVSIILRQLKNFVP